MEHHHDRSAFAGSVAATIDRHRMLTAGERVVVALSGGADSVALLAVLDELGYDCIAAHCNFHLRGEESQRDMRHAEMICNTLGIDLMVRDFDVETHRREKGGSIEMACRELRYSWFDDLLVKKRARAVAVGHHCEDNVETMLLNMFRGTGIDGLRGIRYRRDAVIRPLLDVSRREIEAYLAVRGLGYVTDSSNGSDLYLRNRIRNHIVPEIEKWFPGAVDAMRRTMSHVAAAEDLYDRAVADYGRACVNSDGDFDLGLLIEHAGNSAETVLYEMLKHYGIAPSACSDIISSIARSGLVFHGRDGVMVELDRGILHIRIPQGFTGTDIHHKVDLHRDVLYPVNIRVSEHDVSEFRPERNPSVIYLDASALDKEHVWTLRRWENGDRIRPFGMSGSKLVSDIFTDAKYPARDKRRAWILACDGEPVWIVGLRASRLFEVTPQTRRFIKLEYLTKT